VPDPSQSLRPLLRVGLLLAAITLTSVPPAAAEWVTRSVSCGDLPRAIGVNPITNRVYVAQEASASVLAFDPVTGTTTTIPALNSPDAIAVNPVTNRVYVANQQSSSVTVIDGATDGVVTTVPVGSNPYSLGVNPATNRVYVVNRLGNSVTEINGATNAVVRTIAVGSDPRGVAVNPVTNRIYVNNRSSNTITVIDGATGGTSTVTVGSAPMAIGVNPVTGYIYVANQGGASVTRIHGTTLAKNTITVGSNPYALDVDPVTDRVFVCNVAGASVTVINGATSGTSTVAAGVNPVGVTVNPATGRAYVCNQSSDFITIIDGATNAAQNLTVGSTPLSAVVNPWTGRVYVARNIGSGDGLVEIDAGTNTLSTVAVGGGAGAVAVNRRTHRAYVANESGNSVTEIDLVIRAAVATIPVGATPRAVLVDESRDRIYTADFTSSTVSAIDGATRTVTPVGVDIGPVALALDAESGTVYAACHWDGTVTLVDGVAAEATASVPLGAGAWPAALAVDPATRACHVALRGTNGVARVERDGTLSAVTCVGTSPAAIAVDAERGRVFVANSGDHTVSVLDAAANTVLATVAVGTRPVALAIDRVRGHVYAADSGAAAVTRILSPSLATATVATVDRPVALAVDAWNDRLYVGGLGTSVLSVIDLGSFGVHPLGLAAQAAAVAVDEALGTAVAVLPANSSAALLRAMPASAAPLTSVIAPLAGHLAAPGAQTFSGSSANARTPNNPGILAQFVAVDTPLRRWRPATLVSGAGTPAATWEIAGADPGAAGPHLLLSAALDATSATVNDGSQSQGSVFTGQPAAYVYRTAAVAAAVPPAIDPVTLQGAVSVNVVRRPAQTTPVPAPLVDAWVSVLRTGQALPAVAPLTSATGAYGIAEQFACGDQIASRLENDTLKVLIHGQTPFPGCGTSDCRRVTRTASGTAYDITWPRDDAANAFYLLHEFSREYWEKRLGIRPGPVTVVRVRNDSPGVTGKGGATAGKGTNGVYLDFETGMAEYPDALYHEFSHRMVIQSLGNLVSGRDAEGEENTEARGMDEAFADYFTAAFTESPSIAEGVHGRCSTCPMRDLANDALYESPLCPGAERKNSQYAGALIFGGALWDLRTALRDDHGVDRDDIDRWIYGAINALGPVDAQDRTYLRFHDILKERALNGTYHTTAIDAAFAAHNIQAVPNVNCRQIPLITSVVRTVDQAGQRVAVGFRRVSNALHHNVYLRRFIPPGLEPQATSGFGYGTLVAEGVVDSTFEYVEPDTTLLLAFVVVAVDSSGNEFASSDESPQVTAVHPRVTAAARRFIRALPNPARGLVRVTFAATEGRGARLRLFDVTGRRVRQFEVPAAPGSVEHVVDWDGLDASGRPVPAGVYLARVDGAGPIQEGRVVVVR
jgi:YVTN family beta-propeller protein